MKNWCTAELYVASVPVWLLYAKSLLAIWTKESCVSCEEDC